MRQFGSSRYAQKQSEWIAYLQSMILSGELHAWKGLVPIMHLYELVELISPYEEKIRHS